MMTVNQSESMHPYVQYMNTKEYEQLGQVLMVKHKLLPESHLSPELKKYLNNDELLATLSWEHVTNTPEYKNNPPERSPSARGACIEPIDPVHIYTELRKALRPDL